MNYQPYLFNGKQKYKVGEVKPDDAHGVKKKEGQARLARNREKIGEMQDALYAEGRQSLLVIFQAMDAAGKDGTIEHVFTGVNPQGIAVTSFKQPSGEELAHDYLWRVHAQAPRRGQIGVFNRSHYEDVLVGKVLDLPQAQELPSFVLEDIWKRRYRQIRDFERHLYENGTTIVKIYLHLSQEEQTKRFLDRAKDETKNWKFSQGDIVTSESWDQYMEAYEEAINATAVANAPWYVVPADQKWYARAVVSEIVLDTLKEMHPVYPIATEEQREQMGVFREEREEKSSEAQ